MELSISDTDSNTGHSATTSGTNCNIDSDTTNELDTVVQWVIDTHTHTHTHNQ